MTKARKFERHIRHFLEHKNQGVNLKWFQEFENELWEIGIIIQCSHVRGQGRMTFLEAHSNAGNRDVQQVFEEYLDSLSAHKGEEGRG